MSATDNQPINQSFLSPLGFKLQIKKTPNVNYFIQKVSLPNVSLGEVDVDTPFTKIPYPGTRLSFGNLQVTFKVDEDLKNYMEIFHWLKAMGFPDNFDQYSNIAGMAKTSGDGIFSDITLMTLSSAMHPTTNITFYDCFPVDLSSIDLDSTSADVEYVTATVTFANRRFDIEPAT